MLLLGVMAVYTDVEVYIDIAPHLEVEIDFWELQYVYVLTQSMKI